MNETIITVIIVTAAVVSALTLPFILINLIGIATSLNFQNDCCRDFNTGINEINGRLNSLFHRAKDISDKTSQMATELDQIGEHVVVVCDQLLDIERGQNFMAEKIGECYEEAYDAVTGFADRCISIVEEQQAQANPRRRTKGAR